MGYERGSESRRSRSGARASYVGQRGVRRRSSESRTRRGPDHARSRYYRNRSPEHAADRYRKRSPSDTLRGREAARNYRSGHKASFRRRSTSRSPWRRRSKSLRSAARNERYPPQRDVPSARFGSKASYLRSRDTYRGSSRSPGRMDHGRRSSVLQRDAASNRSESRGRWRERREERNRRYISTERRTRRERSTERADPPTYRGNPRHSRYQDRHVAAGRSRGGSRSQSSQNYRHSPRVSRGRKETPARPQSPSGRARDSKWSRSRTRSGSRPRRGAVPLGDRRSPYMEQRSRRRSDSGSRGRKPAAVDRRSPVYDKNQRQPSYADSRRRDEGSCSRPSPTHDRGKVRRSSSESRRRMGASARSHSPFQDRSLSKERVETETSRRLHGAEPRSRRGSSCRSADCPTPDLGSSRMGCVESREGDTDRHSVCGGEKSGTIQEASQTHVNAAVSEERRASRAGEALSPRTEGRTRVIQAASLSRSPSIGSRAREAEQAEAKEQQSSRATPNSVPEQSASEEARHSPEASALPPDSDVGGQKATSQADEQCHDQEEPSSKKDHASAANPKSSRSSSSVRHETRQRTKGSLGGDDRRSDGACAVGNMSADDTGDSRRVNEPIDAFARSLSNEDTLRSREGDRIAVKRRIVAREPVESPAPMTELYGPPKESPRRRYFRVQRLPPQRPDRMLSSVNRCQPVRPIRWNRFDRDERFEFLPPPYLGNGGRSVRLVSGRCDRNLFISPQFRGGITPNEYQRVPLYGGPFQSAPPNFWHMQRVTTPFPPPGGRGRKMAGLLGRVPQDRRQVAEPSNADGKWSHDLFEQISNEPERKRPRFNLYGETLERVDD